MNDAAVASPIAPAWRRYIDVIRAARPLALDDEIKMRGSILYCRDRAAQLMPHVGWEAVEMLTTVERLAQTYGLATLDGPEIAIINEAVHRLIDIAGRVERFGPGRAR